MIKSIKWINYKTPDEIIKINKKDKIDCSMCNGKINYYRIHISKLPTSDVCLKCAYGFYKYQTIKSYINKDDFERFEKDYLKYIFVEEI